MNGYRENSAKTFERLIQAQYKLKPKKKHIYSATILDVDARHDEQKCYLILMVRRFCLHVCYLGLVNSSLPPPPPPSGETFPRCPFSNQVKICVFVCGKSRPSGITWALSRTLDTLLLVKRNISPIRPRAAVSIQK